MPTTPEKPAKPRTRNRKASQQKTAKAGPKPQVKRDQAEPDQVTLDAAPTSPVIARLEGAPVDVTPVETTTVETTPIEPAAAELVSDVASVDVAPQTAAVAVAFEEAGEENSEAETVQEQMIRETMAQVEMPREEIAQVEMAEQHMVQEAVLNGEVLPPGVRDPAPQAGFSAIAQAYGDYTRKSWLNGRFLVERLIAVRSLDEAIEVQGEFAKQAYTNFIVQSERICVLYGEWTQQFFRPFEKFAAGWPRIGR